MYTSNTKRRKILPLRNPLQKQTYKVVCWLCVFLFAACGGNKPKEKLPKEPLPPSFDLQAFTETLKLHCLKLEADSGSLLDTLLKQYQSTDYQPVWARQLSEKNRFDKLMVYLSSFAEEAGFDPLWYQFDSLTNQYNLAMANEPNYSLLAEIELSLSASTLRLHKDQALGRTHPEDVLGTDYMLPKRKVPDFKLFAVLDGINYADALHAHDIKDKTFLRYKNLLAQWTKMKKDSSVSWTTIDFKGIKKIEPDSPTVLMPAIAHKLFQMGILTQAEITKSDSHHYNREFVPYIKKAQTSFGLMDDGILGRKTFKILNTTIDSRIEEIRVNMERFRWFIPDSTERCVWVNIPNYTLVTNYVDSTRSMKVAVGKARPYNYDEQMEKYKKTGKWYHKPKDHSTPQIYSKIKYLVLNPTWTVPNSIIMREMYWKMRRDSSYLRRNNYRVYYRKQQLNPDTINWSRIAPTKIPYKIVQGEGESNALGRVKYIFYNPFSIYLHDTPQKSKFKWTERAVSHGCVRVAEPYSVAEFLLQDNKKFSYDDFRIKLGMPPLDEERLKDYNLLDTLAEIQAVDTTELHYLHKRVPIYFLYHTIFFQTDGTPVFRNDVYGYNRKIYKAMRRKDWPRVH